MFVTLTGCNMCMFWNCKPSDKVPERMRRLPWNLSLAEQGWPSVRCAQCWVHHENVPLCSSWSDLVLWAVQLTIQSTLLGASIQLLPIPTSHKVSWERRCLDFFCVCDKSCGNHRMLVIRNRRCVCEGSKKSLLTKAQFCFLFIIVPPSKLKGSKVQTAGHCAVWKINVHGLLHQYVHCSGKKK